MKNQSAWFGWIGTAAILIAALLRVMTVPSRLPYWDLDPLTNWMPETTRTPAMGLMLDALVWIGASAVIWAESTAGRRIAWKSGFLIVLGCIGVFLHGAVFAPLVATGGSPPMHGDLAMLTLGSAWANAMIGAWALAHAARHPASKRILVATLIGFVCVLCVRGGYQVFVEHPRTLAVFDANQQALLIAQGIEPGSTTAMLYERRLRQVEATGWSGLANVYGSMVAFGLLAWASVALAAAKLARRGVLSSGEAGLTVLVALVAALALMWSGSKGAVGALLIGCAVCAIAWWITRRRAAASKWLPRIMVAIPVVVLCGVVFRGVIGERIGELSMLFRWHYLSASAYIFMEHPLFGVGPAGFKDAYMLVKPALNPEEVESPHSLFFDWVATLGVFGVAWSAVWLRWLWSAGIPASGKVPSASDSPLGIGWQAVVICMVVGLSIWREWAALGLDLVLLIVLAGAAWLFISRIALRVLAMDDSLMCKVVLGCMAALAAHAMIELTPVSAGSAAWFMSIFAVLGAQPHAHDPRIRSALSRWIVCTLLIVVAGALVWRAGTTLAWERALRQASLEARGISSQSGVDGSISRTASWMCIDGAAEADRVGRMLAHLSRANELEPSVIELRSKLLRISLAPASCPSASSDMKSECIRQAITIGEAMVVQWPRSSSAWARLAGASEAAWTISDDQIHLVRAIDAWGHVAVLDPNGLTPRLRLVRLSHALGDESLTTAWALETLEIDRMLRLDPLRQLSPELRSWLQSISSGEPERQ